MVDASGPEFPASVGPPLLLEDEEEEEDEDEDDPPDDDELLLEPEDASGGWEASRSGGRMEPASTRWKLGP